MRDLIRISYHLHQTLATRHRDMRRESREDRSSRRTLKAPRGSVVQMNPHEKDTKRIQDPKFVEAEPQIKEWQTSRVHAGELTPKGACREAPTFLRWLWINKPVNTSRVAYLCQACLTGHKDASTPTHGNSHGLLLPAMRATHVTLPSICNAQDHESSPCFPT